MFVLLAHGMVHPACNRGSGRSGNLLPPVFGSGPEAPPQHDLAGAISSHRLCIQHPFHGSVTLRDRCALRVFAC